MSLQFPLIFIFGQPGYHTKLMVRSADPNSKMKRVSMNAFYTYQLHARHDQYDLLFWTGRLFQQYVVGVYCCIEQNRMDFYRTHQNDIRGEYLSGLYDAVSRGDHDGSEAGSRIILPSLFTVGPRYMYSHYLDALAICRVLGNPQFFITFTCNVNWPEIQRYMAAFPHLTASDRADIICRVFEQKLKAFVKFLKRQRPFGQVIGGADLFFCKKPYIFPFISNAFQPLLYSCLFPDSFLSLLCSVVHCRVPETWSTSLSYTPLDLFIKQSTNCRRCWLIYFCRITWSSYWPARV